MRNLGALVSSALLLWVSAARAQAASGVDLQALPLPLSADAGSAFETAQALKAGGFRWSLRTSGLRKPLTLRLPTPAPEGTSAGLVRGVVLSELSANVGLGAGWDAGFGFGIHLHQSTATENGRGDTFRVDSFLGRDPRLGIGWSHAIGKWSLRPYAQLHLPLGDAEGLAGERPPRAGIGVAQLFDATAFSWSSQLSFLYREPRSISSTAWGPQILLGTGAFVPVYGALEIGLQIVAAPVLGRQEGRSGARGARVIPGEIIGSMRRGGHRLSWGLGVGFGLPLSRTSSVHVQQKAVLGPTTPTYRAFLDLKYEH